MATTYFTEAELAGRLGLSLNTVRTLRQQHDWPHLRFGRAVRYTEEQIERIDSLQAWRGDPWKRTPLSVARSSRRRARGAG
ncbi:helix-turn-helix domain-containing protein [Nocardioides sp. Bht2]|uniref:helix-turn-helix domain-containing protein n=1 Tax=Nocardioides sp. Bht2 TaxID=3392297 RepID=UPI0039B596E8